MKTFSTFQDLAQALREGVFPHVRFNKGIQELDTYAEDGIQAVVKSVAGPDRDGLYSFEFEFTPYEESNLPLESAVWYGHGEQAGTLVTARERGHYMPTEKFYFDKNGKISEYMEVNGTELSPVQAFINAGKKFAAAKRALDLSARRFPGMDELVMLVNQARDANDEMAEAALKLTL